MDTYECLTYVYNAFEQYGMPEYQKKAIDLMEHYATIIEVWKCRSQCNQLKIRYYKQIQNRELLFKAYNQYYELEQEYHNANMKENQIFCCENRYLKKWKIPNIKSIRWNLYQKRIC